MKKIAIIPARGGSKRIPRKNIKDFLGKPIIAYSIEAALNSLLFDEVMVSTDNIEIAEISRKYGASVPFMRSSINSSDTATTVDAIMEVLDWYSENTNMKFDIICCIYPTAPLIKNGHLKMGYDLIQTKEFDSVLPVVPFSYPIWRGLRCKSGFVNMAWPEFYNSRSQDLEPIYHDAGQWYWLKENSLREQKKLFMEKSHGLILKPSEVQDIDTMEDWGLAEMKYSSKLY